MPRRSRRPCSSPGCPALIWDGRYCQDHASQENRQQDQRRGSSTARGYGARWRRLRLMKLKRDPVCEDPFALHRAGGQVVAANEVDHIIALRKNGKTILSNLQSLCKSCHSRKTILEDGGLGREGGGKSL